MELGTEKDLIEAHKCFVKMYKAGITPNMTANVNRNIVCTATRLGKIFEDTDRHDLCLEYMLRTHEHVKHDHVLNYNIGRLFEKRGMAKLAIQYLEAALAEEDKYVDYYLELNLVLREIGDPAKCRKYLLDGLSKVDMKEPLYKELGNLLCNSDPLEAIETYKKALTSRMDIRFLATIHMNIGNCYLKLCDIDQGIQQYIRSMNIDPSLDMVLYNYAMASLYTVGASERELWTINQEIGRRMMNIHGKKVAGSASTNKTSGSPSKIRIGFISGDLFGSHPVTRFVGHLLNKLDTDRFELFCYSNQFIRERNDGKGKEMYSDKIKWFEIKNISTEKAGALILSHDLHIIVDLSGFTEGNRCDLMCNRLAPEQICYIGYPFHPSMLIDHFVGDPVMKCTTPGLVERMITLPTCYTQYTPPFVPKPETLACAYTGNGITFGAFNKPNKTNQQVRDAFYRILIAVPGSRLIVKDKNVEELMLKEHPDLDKDTISHLGIVTDYKDFVHCYNRVDIALDTFPWTGTTTTCEGLLMGTPVITLAPKSAPYHQKSSASILVNSGLKDFVASSVDEYVSKAAICAKNIPRMHKTYKQKIQESFLNGHVVAAPNYIAEVESMFIKLAKLQ
jgi:predicted O-linked N-acetylglucosamine transferase (SPINDLY family)